MSETTHARLELTDQFLAAWQRWRGSRLAALNAPDGPPTLVGTHWLDETDTVPGVPGRWVSRGGATVLVLDDNASVTVDGVARTGELVVLAEGAEVGPRIHLAALTVQVTARVGRRGVRVFDHERSGAISHIEAFEPSTDWVIDGVFTPTQSRASVAYRYALESAPRRIEVPGIVSFTLGGRRYQTRPFLDEGPLLLVFADRTSGQTTKPPSRFLTFSPPVDMTREASPVTLDFNRAFLPPCAFSDEFNCPLPPSGHRFDIELTAGESWARWARQREAAHQ